MKRLIWLLITVLGTAFAQVQPVVSPLAQDEACCCTGGQAGACGMPECAPAPTACPASPNLLVATSQRAEARKSVPAPRALRESYFARFFDTRPAIVPASRVSLQGTPAASVPLFTAYCSFLI